MRGCHSACPPWPASTRNKLTLPKSKIDTTKTTPAGRFALRNLSLHNSHGLVAALKLATKELIATLRCTCHPAGGQNTNDPAYTCKTQTTMKTMQEHKTIALHQWARHMYLVRNVGPQRRNSSLAWQRFLVGMVRANQSLELIVNYPSCSHGFPTGMHPATPNVNAICATPYLITATAETQAWRTNRITNTRRRHKRMGKLSRDPKTTY